MKQNIPAFPYNRTSINRNGQWETIAESGMTLRDWFAGMALQGWLSTFDDYPIPEDCNPMAQSMYKIADAMMKARGE